MVGSRPLPGALAVWRAVSPLCTFTFTKMMLDGAMAVAAEPWGISGCYESRAADSNHTPAVSVLDACQGEVDGDPTQLQR